MKFKLDVIIIRAPVLITMGIWSGVLESFDYSVEIYEIHKTCKIMVFRKSAKSELIECTQCEYGAGDKLGICYYAHRRLHKPTDSYRGIVLMKEKDEW